MGKIVVTSEACIGRYEKDEVQPIIDVTIKAAASIGVSLVYCVGKIFLEIDQSMLNRI